MHALGHAQGLGVEGGLWDKTVGEGNTEDASNAGGEPEQEDVPVEAGWLPERELGALGASTPVQVSTRSATHTPAMGTYCFVIILIASCATRPPRKAATFGRSAVGARALHIPSVSE